MLSFEPLSPRLQALASPGPCTPFSLEDVLPPPLTTTTNDYPFGTHNSSLAILQQGQHGQQQQYGGRDVSVQERLDAAFARHRAGVGERRTYSSVLAAKRRIDS